MFTFRKCVFSFVNAEQFRKPLSLTTQRYVKRWVAPTLRELKRRKDKMGEQPPQHRSTFLEWNYHAELYAFGKRLNEEFRADVLQNALTHRSYILQEQARQEDLGIEDPQLSIEDNKRLAEEGEKLMSAYLKRYLRTTLPQFPEEGICAVHDHLMTDAMLSNISSHIGTKDLILCSDFPPTEATLAVTLKAVVGALAASSGIDRAHHLVRDLVLTQLAGQDVNDLWHIERPMEMLRDILRREKRSEPEPRLIHEAGRNTILAAYQVAIYVDKEYQGKGAGESIVTATEMAARDVLRRMFHTTENMKPISFDLNTSQTKVDSNTTLQEWTSRNVVQA